MSIDDDKEIAAEIRPRENVDRQAGAQKEREAIVRYLDAIGFKDLAGDIEDGEHLKVVDNG